MRAAGKPASDGSAGMSELSINRRLVLRMLALSGLLLSSLGRKALAETVKPAEIAPQIPPLDGPQGLPSDFRIVPPLRWNTVDAHLTRRLDPTLRDTSPIDIGGISVSRASGKIETGKLDPVGQAVDLPPSLDALVLPADQALSLDVLNREFNPFVSDPRGSNGKPLVGPFSKGGEVYEGKTLLPIRLIMKMTLEVHGGAG